MKKCPTCGKTFEDSMRFCQVDGTPLVADEPTFDPYATIVAPSGGVTPPPDEPPADTAAGEPAETPGVNVGAPAAVDESESAIDEPQEVLDLPDQADPLRTMYVSDDEMKEAMGQTADSGELELPPDPPKFNEPEIPSPKLGDLEPSAEPAPPSPMETTNPPIPSPFGSPDSFGSVSSSGQADESEMETVVQPEPQEADAPEEPVPATPFEAPSATPPPSPFQADEPAAPPTPFAEPEPPAPMASSPMDAAAPEQEWSPPPAPVANWEGQDAVQNAPFQPPVDGAAGQNKTLPIVSLILGIVSLCCYVSPITGLAAVITGFMGMKNVNNDPNTYGGKGLAMAGMIVGGIFFLVGVAYYVFIILVYAGMIAGSALPNF